MKKHYEKPMNEGYERQEVVENYATKRFSGRSYSHTHCREIKIIESFFKTTGIISSVADIPCGAGRFQSLLKKHAKKIVEMDYSSQMLCKAEENMHENLSEMLAYTEFIRSSIFDIPFDDNSFEMCFSIRLYHHFEEEEERIAILRELKRVSEKWIILTFFNSCSYLSFRRDVKKKYFGKKRTRHSISMKQFKKELASAGLQIHSLRSVLPFYSEQTLVLLKKCN